MPKRATGPRPLYCSKAHQNRANYLSAGKARAVAAATARRAATVKVCPTCCAEFTPALTVKQIYCSARCSRAATRDSKSTTCMAPDCPRPRRARGLCNMHYRRILRAEGRELAPVWDERRAARWRARRARIKGAVDVAAFSYRDVFERDGWQCGICGEAVDPEARYPDPMSASLDHVVPLSKGGAHTLENAQCAHLVCNLRKGATSAA